MAAKVVSGRSGSNRLLILCYHRVLPQPDPMLPDTVDARTFSRHMGVLRRHFTVLPLQTAVELLASNELPPLAVSITFDDGYADNWSVAAPILKQFDLPATLFVASGYLNGGRMWNDTIVEAVRRIDAERIDLETRDIGPLPLRTMEERAGSAMRIVLSLRRMTPAQRMTLTDLVASHVSSRLPTDLMLTSEQLQQLHDAGFEIGAHTVSHPILANLPYDQAVQEIRDSQDELRRLLGDDIRGFAYPNGHPGTDYGIEHVNAAREAGFEYAVTTSRGTGWTDTDRFQLPRLDPWDRSPLRFMARLVNEYRHGPSAAL